METREKYAQNTENNILFMRRNRKQRVEKRNLRDETSRIAETL